MKRQLPPVLFILSSGLPSVLSATPTDGTPHIALTELGLSPTANTRIVTTDDGEIIAIVTTGDSEIIEIGLATFDVDNQLIFGKAQMINDAGNLLLQMAKSGGALMIDNKALSLDPRIVAEKALNVGLGHSLTGLVAKVEGEGKNAQLIFGTKADIGDGTAVEATKIVLADKMFIVAITGDITLVAPVMKSGKTFIASGDIGHVDPEVKGVVADVTPTDLAAFGIGISPVPSRLALTGHGATLATAAA